MTDHIFQGGHKRSPILYTFLHSYTNTPPTEKWDLCSPLVAIQWGNPGHVQELLLTVPAENPAKSQHPLADSWVRKHGGVITGQSWSPVLGKQLLKTLEFPDKCVFCYSLGDLCNYTYVYANEVTHGWAPPTPMLLGGGWGQKTNHVIRGSELSAPPPNLQGERRLEMEWDHVASGLITHSCVMKTLEQWGASRLVNTCVRWELARIPWREGKELCWPHRGPCPIRLVFF